MNAPEFDRELMSLIGSIRDERITAAELQSLEARLADDPEARRTYLMAITLHGLLEQSAASIPTERPPDNVADRSPASDASLGWPVLVASAVAAVAAMLLVAVSLSWLLSDNSPLVAALRDAGLSAGPDDVEVRPQVIDDGVEEVTDAGVPIVPASEEPMRPLAVSPPDVAPNPPGPLVPVRDVDFNKLQAVRVKVEAAATNYRMKIESVYRVGDELWVVARISRTKDEVGGDAITTLSDTVYINPLALPVKHKIVGVHWVWQKDDDTTEYVQDEKTLAKRLRDKGQRINHRRKPGEGPTTRIGENVE